MDVYPIMLKLTGRDVVVIGGGPVAVRKARSLLACGAKVKVVAESFADFAATNALAGAELVCRSYEPADLDGASLVVACTSEKSLNARIADDARRAGALVNCVDQPEACDFFVPAIVSAGAVVVAISTSGLAPALCAHLRELLSAAMPERIGAFAEALAKLRDDLKNRIDDAEFRGRIMKQLASRAGFDAFVAGGFEALAGMLEQLISRGSA